jgi:16S rRNA processing protein RimM
MVAGPTLRRPVVLGRVHGLFGIHGWLKVFSYTRPSEAIFDYRCWWLGNAEQHHPYQLRAARNQGRMLVAQLADEKGRPLPDRDAAAALLGLEIAVDRAAMPEPEPGQYYWWDLIGLAVATTDGIALGRVSAMMETGANDVLVVTGERERLIPMVADEFVKGVDLEAGTIVVDWDPEF